MPDAMTDPSLSSAAPSLGRFCAGRGRRLLATLVDWLTAWAPLLVGSFFVVEYGDPEYADPRGGPFSEGLFFLVMLCFVAAVLSQLYMMVSVGQSLGKRMLRIQVVHMDGSPVDLVRIVFWRNILPSVVGLLVTVLLSALSKTFSALFIGWVLFFLVDTLFIFTAKRRCLHDYIAGTQVIAVPKSSR